ncbi:MAG: hypothetical protein IJE25_08320 [Clostridia bacterium]|nr:hypothetical protein [Clostridia bacterium]
MNKDKAIAAYDAARAMKTATRNTNTGIAADFAKKHDKESIIKAYNERQEKKRLFERDQKILARKDYTTNYTEDQRKAYYEVVNAPDFEEYSSKGLAIQNPDPDKSGLIGGVGIYDINSGWGKMHRWDGVNNKVTYAKTAQKQGTTRVLGDSEYLRYTQLNDAEVAIYSYYLAKEGPEKAEEYLKSIDTAINQRIAGIYTNAMGDSSIAKVGYGFGAGIEQFARGFQGWIENEALSPSAMQIAGQKARDDLGGTGKVAYDVSQAIGNMFPSVMLSFIPAAGPWLSAASVGVSAGGNARQELIKEGYSTSEATQYGLLVGTAETVLSKLLSVASKGAKLDGVVDKLASKLKKGVSRAVVKVGFNAVKEGFEEGFQEILAPVFKQMATGDDFEGVDWEEVFYSAAIGALTGGVMDLSLSGVNATYRAFDRTFVTEGRRILELEHSDDSLLAAAESSEDEGIKKTLERLKKAKQGSNNYLNLLGKLSNQVVAQYGVELSEQLSLDEQMAQGGKEAVIENFSGGSEFEKATREYLGRKAEAERAVEAQNAEVGRVINNATDARPEAKYGEWGAEAYRNGLNSYSGSETEYRLWFELARNLGLKADNRSLPDMINTLSEEDRSGLLKLDNETLNAAFNLGLEYMDNLRIAEIKANSHSKGEGSSGVSSVERVKISENAKKSLGQSQLKAIKRLQALSRLLSGYSFVVETAEDNPLLIGANGYIDQDHSVIHINIEAGRVIEQIGDYALDAALTHEVGHGIKENAPRLFEELKSFVHKEFFPGQSWDAIVERRQRQYQAALNAAAKKNNTEARSFTWEDAEEEVVCNSLGKMLTSKRVMESLSTEHRSLFGRIWRAIKNFFARITGRMSSAGEYANKTTEQRIVEQGVKSKQAELERLFVNALKAANSNAAARSDARLAAKDKTTDDSNAAKSNEKSALTNTNSENVHVSGEKLSYSIVELDDGKQYVEASEKQIITGTDPQKWAIQVADYINKVIRNGSDLTVKTTDGDYLTITRDTAYKAGTRNQVRNPDGTYRTMTDSEYLCKLNAEIHINELAEISKNSSKLPTPDYKNHRFAKDGFTYRTAYFKDFDGSYYKLTISVGENGSVSTVYNVGKMKKDTLPSGKIVSTFSGSKANKVSSSNIIPDSAEKSNSFAEKFSNSLKKTSENSIISSNESEAKNKPDGKASSDTSIEKNNKGESVNEQQSQDTGILEGQVLSAASEGENNQRQRSNDSETAYRGVARNRDTSRYDTGGDSYRKNVSGYLARTDIVSPYNFKRYQESILRGLEGKLADRDSSGRNIPKQIKEKFKNTVLKNENGELLSAFHWTNNIFDTFKYGEAGFHFGTYQAALDRRIAKSHKLGADRVKEVYLNIKNPVFLEDFGFWDASAIAPQLWEKGLISIAELTHLQRTKGYTDGEYNDEASKAIRKILDDLGYDGIIYQNATEDNGTLSVAALYPEQIYTVTEENVSNNDNRVPRELDTEDPSLNERGDEEITQMMAVDSDIRYSLADKLNREALADAFLTLAETDEERVAVRKYRQEIDKLDVLIDERGALQRRFDKLKGKKGLAGERTEVNARIKAIDDYITRHDAKLLELSTAKPLRDLVSRAQRRTGSGASKSTATEVTISRGKLNRERAEFMHDKVYTKKDAQSALEKINDFENISGKTKNELFDELWQGLNGIENESERTEFVRTMADKVLDRLQVEAMTENPDYIESREMAAYFKGYVGRLSFSEDMKAEINHKLDKDGSKAFLGRWGNKRSDKAPTPADVFVTEFARENPGYEYLEDMNAADALFEIDGIYDRISDIEKKVSTYDEASPKDLAAIKGDIVNKLLDAFKGGRPSARAKYEGTVNYYKATLALDRLARSIRDMKLGTFDNATQVKGDAVMGLLRDLAKFEYRRTFTPARVREKIRGLSEWYTKENRMLCYESEDHPGQYLEEVKDKLEAIGNGDGALSAAELGDLYDVMAYFKHLAETYNKVFYQGKWVDAPELAKHYIAKLTESYKSKGGWMARFVGLAPIRSYLDNFSDPLSVVSYHDAYVEDGFFTSIFRMLQDATVKRDVAHSESLAEYNKFLRDNPNYRRNLQTQYIEILGKRVPKAQAIALYMTLKQKDTHAGFAYNGFKFTDFNGEADRTSDAASLASIEYKRRILAKKNSSEQEISESEAYDRIEITVEKEDERDYLTPEEMSDYAERMRETIEAELTQIDKEIIAIEERGFNGRFRNLKYEADMKRQGYSNIRSTYYFPTKRGDIAEKAESKEKSNSVSNISANKNRVPGARQLLELQDFMTTYEDHARDICNYAYLQSFIDFFNKIYNVDVSGNPNAPKNISVIADKVWGIKKTTTGRVIKHGNYKYLTELIEDVKGSRINDSWFNEITLKLRSGLVASSLAFNGKVLLSQLTSYGAAAHIIDVASLSKGVAKVLGKTRGGALILTKKGRERLTEFGKEVDKYCPLARLRHEDNQIYLAQAVTVKKDGSVRIKGKGAELLEKGGELGMKPIGGVDRIVVCTLFEACKYSAEREGFALGTEENLVEAGKLLKIVILDTQQNSLATERSRAMRSPSEILKSLTMFSADSMKTMGRVLDSLGRVSYLRKRLAHESDPDKRAEIEAEFKQANFKMAKSLAVLGANSAFMAAVALLFSKLRGKWEEDESVFGYLAKNFGENLCGGLPLIRDIVSQLTDGYEMNHDALESISSLVDAVRSLFSTVGGLLSGEKDGKDVVRLVRKLAFALGQTLGVPARNIWNAIYGFLKMIGAVE